MKSMRRQTRGVCCFNSTSANSVSVIHGNGSLGFQTPAFVSAPRRFMLMPPELKVANKTSSCCFKVRERRGLIQTATRKSSVGPHMMSLFVLTGFIVTSCESVRKRCVIGNIPNRTADISASVRNEGKLADTA